MRNGYDGKQTSGEGKKKTNKDHFVHYFQPLREFCIDEQLQDKQLGLEDLLA